MRKKLKIAIFHLAFIYSGGGEKLVLEQAKGLKELGHDVTIFTPIKNSEKCFPDIIGDFSIKTFLPNLSFITSGHESVLILLACVLAPFFAFRFKNFDVILAANQPSPWIAWWVKILFGVPYISYLAQPTRFLHPRNIDKRTGLVFTKKESESMSAYIMHKSKRFINWADITSIRGSDRVLANGEYIKEVLQKTYGVSTISCSAGAYTIKRIKNHELRIRGNIKIGKKTINKPYLLLTNRHFAQKRFEFAISALAALLRDLPELSLVITGEETQYTDQLKSLVRQLSLNAEVKFLGLVKERDLIRLYANAYVYLYTAPEEDFGMGIIEAMVHGAPVVAWNNAGPARIIINGKTGLLAKPFSISDFTLKIQKLILEPKLASEIAKSGHERAISEFSYKKHIKILEEQIRNVSRNYKKISH